MNKTAAEDIVHLYQELVRCNMNHGSSGNVSCREADRFLITPTGATATSLAAQQLVEVPLTGTPQPGTAPSSEWAMHAAVYAACPEAGFVVHTHADACTALACLNEPLPAFHYTVLGFGGNEVPCVPYHTFGTEQLANAVRTTMPGYKACLLANHGMICHGPDAATALAAGVRLETLARQYLLARSAGTPRLLNAEEIHQARLRYQTYGKPIDAHPTAAAPSLG